MKSLPISLFFFASFYPLWATEEQVAENSAVRDGSVFIVRDLLGDERKINDTDGDEWDDIWSMLFPDIAHSSKTADTDGDGVSDYDEMLLWRDPVIPGPPPVKLTAAEMAAADESAQAASLEASIEGHAALEAEMAVSGEDFVQGFDGGQPDPDWLRPDNTSWLAGLQTDIAAFDAAAPVRQAELQRVAAKFDMPLSGKDEYGSSWSLAGEQSGQPMMILNQDAIASNTINADDLWPGLTPTAPFFSWQDLSKSRNLTGFGVLSAIFDVDGSVLTTHQEFGNRVSNHFPGTPSNHSTAVADVIAGGGVIDVIKSGVNQGKVLKGVAYESSVRSYDVGGFQARLMEEIAAGTRFSNHSFAYISGWERAQVGNKIYWLWRFPDFTEDPRLGLYGPNVTEGYGSPQFDLAVRKGLVHLPVIGSGNTNGYGPSAPTQYQTIIGGYYSLQPATVVRDWINGDDGGYDTITIPATSKNGLSVGSIKDVVGGVVELSAYSGTGPTDDYRIKPDVVAVGERNSALGKGNSLFLAHSASNTAYYNDVTADSDGIIHQKGTSFAAPLVTGGLVLAQQRWQQLHPTAAPPLASTWRALAIHTAQDIGSPGPDFKCGWGIFDAAALVGELEADAALGRGALIKEFGVGNAMPKSFYVTLPANQAGRATLAWTDLSDGRGFDIGKELDNTSSELINDLALRIQDVDTDQIHYPWIIDYSVGGETAAVRGAPAVNIPINGRIPNDRVNNVERIDIAPENRDRRFKITVSPDQFANIYVGDTYGGSNGVGSQTVSMVLSNVIPEEPRNVTLKFNYLLSNGPVCTLSFNSDPGAYYTLESSQTLESGSWVTGETFKAETSSTSIVVYGATGQDKKFWRVKRAL